MAAAGLAVTGAATAAAEATAGGAAAAGVEVGVAAGAAAAGAAPAGRAAVAADVGPEVATVSAAAGRGVRSGFVIRLHGKRTVHAHCSGHKAVTLGATDSETWEASRCAAAVEAHMKFMGELEHPR